MSTKKQKGIRSHTQSKVEHRNGATRQNTEIQGALNTLHKRHTTTLTFTCLMTPEASRGLYASSLEKNGNSPTVVLSLKSIKPPERLPGLRTDVTPLLWTEAFISHPSSSRSLKAVTRKDDLWTRWRHWKRFRPLFFSPYTSWSWSTSDAHLLYRASRTSLAVLEKMTCLPCQSK